MKVSFDCVCRCCPGFQVTAELGYPYEDQEYLLEPDHGAWMDDVAFNAGKDAADIGACMGTLGVSGGGGGGGGGHYGKCCFSY